MSVKSLSTAPLSRPRATAAHDIGLEIKRLIFTGNLRPGDRVPQAEIALTLGVSATPVREAVVALGQEGRVVLHAHRGAFVAPFDAGVVHDHFELCGVVFGHAARLASERADDAALDRLMALGKRIAATKSPDALLDFVTAFYALVNQVAGSSSLRAALRSLAGIVPGNLFAVVPAAGPIAREGMTDMLAAMRQRDGRAAADSCARMYRRHGDAIVAHLIDQGVFGA